MRQFLRDIVDRIVFLVMSSLYIALVFGGLAGAFYWAHKDNLVMVVGALLVPFLALSLCW